MSFDGSFFAFLGLVFAAACTGVFFRPGEWYERLRKPSWTPPNKLFGPVWSVLYLMIAVSGWLVWSEQGSGPSLALWAAQLVVNGVWSYLFFSRRRMDLAMADVCLLWLLVASYIVAAWPVSEIAALLFAPYLLWVTIASALNWTVWRMNLDAPA